MSIQEKIKALSEKYFEEVLELRRTIHQNPELAFEEYETAALVSKQLSTYGISHQTGVAKTGVVGLINENKKGGVVALRADMDALPILEQNEVPYKSQNEGKMHACGHDVHTSCLLGAAKILNELKDELPGTVKLIFQPSEEKLPGGASVMIKEGVLENPKPDLIIGQHVMPLIERGNVGFRPGMYMASADEITLTIKGKGGHAALPHMAVDTVSVMAQIIGALQHLVSRKANPLIPTVLSFCTVEAGNGAFNVLPETVVVKGTLRTLDEKWRSEAHVLIAALAEQTAKAHGAECEVFINIGYPMLFNNEDLTQRSIQFANEYLGQEQVEALDLWMAAEDFAYYSQEANACFYRLGTRSTPRGITSAVHTPTFDIDEEALKIGMGLMAYLAYSNLVALQEA